MGKTGNTDRQFLNKMAPSLDVYLSAEEISTLSDVIKDKLSTAFAENESGINELRVEQERLNINLEQTNFDWETQLKECRTKLELEIERTRNLEEKNADLETKLIDYQNKLQKLQDEKFQAGNDLIQAGRQCELLESEKKELVELLEKKNNELDHWNAEWKSLSEKLSESNAENLQYLAKLQDVNVRCSALELREKRLEQERDLTLRQVEALNVELGERNHELLSVRKKRYADVLDVQTQLETATTELKTVSELKDVLQKTVEEKSEKVEMLIGQLKECNTAHIHMEEQYRQELRAQVKLTELYKNAQEKEKGAVDELTTALQAIQSVYKDAAAETLALQSELDTSREELSSELDARQAEVTALRAELKHANALLQDTKRQMLTDEEIEKLSPAAASVSRTLRAGMPLTQLYGELVSAKEELIAKDAENKQLNLYLSEVVQQLEERAPLVKKLRDDYDKAVETIATMKHKSSEAIMEYDKTKMAAEEARFRCRQFEKENNRLRLQISDLSQQVCVLLREAEEARSGYMSLSANAAGSDQQVTSSSQVITQRMVAFRNIEELQKRNCELLAVARELSTKHEDAEAKETETIRQEMEAAVRNALNEVQELRESKERQTAMLESIVRQRDMYRMLLAQSGSAPVSGDVQDVEMAVVSSSPGGKQKDVAEDEAKEAKLAAQQSQRELENYKVQMKETEKILTEQVEKQRSELSAAQVENAKLKSQVEFAAERYKNLKSNFESYKKEIAAFNEKNQRLAAMNAKQEHVINTLREETMEVQRKLSQAEVHLENLKSEHDILKRTESRLQIENENQAQKYLEHNLLAANLQAIQNQLERSQVEMKIRLNSRIEMLERECTSLRQKLDRENEQYKEAVKIWETELKKVQSKLDAEMQKEKKTRDELIDSYSIVHGLKQEISEMEAKLKLAQNKPASEETRANIPAIAKKPTGLSGETTAADAQTESVQFLRIRMKELQTESNALTDQLKLSNDSVQQYKNLAAGFEQQLQEQCGENKNLYDMMQQKLNEMSAAAAAVKEESEKAKTERDEMAAELNKLSETNNEKLMSSQSEFNRLQRELEDSKRCRDEAVRNEAAAHKESQEQSSRAKEAQDKYERELMLHASDVKVFAELKNQLERANAMIANAEETARRSEAALKSAKDSWLVQEAQLRKEGARVLKKCQDLEKQNELLYSEIDKLSSKLIALQSSGDVANRSFGEVDDGEKSSEQLLQVIKYLRREKEMADTRNEVCAAECQRLRLKSELTEKQLGELRESSGKEERQSQATIATAAQHAELLHKVQMLNVLTDSNRLLREERTGLDQQNKVLEAKVASLEKEMSPLQESNQELGKLKDALVAETQALKAEVKRWQTHAQQLLEQTNKMKPEDYQRALQDKETLQNQVGSLQEEVHRLKAENSQLNLLKVDIANVNLALQKKTQQLKRSAEESDGKDSQMAEQVKTIREVKQIGRKYKAQYHELKVQYDQLVAKDEQAAQHEAVVAAAQEAGVQDGKQQMEAKVQEAEEKGKQLALQVQQKDEELSAFKAADEKSRKLLQSARQRIVQLNAQRDEHSRTLEDLRTRLTIAEQAKDEESLRGASMKSQFEAQVGRLENGLSEARENLATVRQENEQLRHEVEELSHRVSQMQQRSHLGQASGAKLQSVAGPSREGSILSQSSETPPTANIKPISTRTDTPPSHRAPHPLGVSTTSGTSTRSTPTASIRPITATASSTRTATITPTSAMVSIAVVHSDTHEGHTPSPPSSVPQATVAPTAAVVPVTAAVSPHPVVEQVTEDADDGDGQMQGTQADDAVPEASAGEMGDEAAVEHFASQSGVATALVNPLVEQIHGEVIADVAGSSSQETRSVSHVSISAATPGKRTREDPDSSDNVPAITLTPMPSSAADRPPKKRTRMTAAEVTSTSPEKTTRAERVQREVTVSVVHNVADELDVEAVNPVSVSSSGANQTERGDSPIADSDIIVVTSDEEAQEPSEEAHVPIEEEEDDEDERDYRDDQYEEEQMQEVESEDVDVDDKSYEAEEMAEDDEDEVEIIDEDDEEQPMEEPHEVADADPVAEDEPREASEVPPSANLGADAAAAAHGRPSCLPRSAVVRTERLQSTGRQQQLTPFVPIGSGTGFEDGDSIVPSTPTLFDPRRNDGFAEALSSPQVPQGRFVFGNSHQEAAVPSCHSALSQLASQGALGVDDTRMDLSQFDEGSGRSVPTTPLQVSPPAETMNTEVTCEPQLTAEANLTVRSEPEIADAASVERSSACGGHQPPETTRQDLPSITVTSEEDAVLGVEDVTDDGIVVSEENTSPIIEEPDAVETSTPETTDSTIVIVDVTTSDGASTSRETSSFTVQGADERDCEDATATQRFQQQTNRQNQQQMQRRPTPIVWTEPSPSSSRAHLAPLPPLMGPSPSAGSSTGPLQTLGPCVPSAPQMGFGGRGMPRTPRHVRRIRIAGGMSRGMGQMHRGGPGGGGGGGPNRGHRGNHPGNVGIGRGDRGNFRHGWRGGQQKGRATRTPPRS